MPEARVSAQAKINLRLKVLAREADGYHSLETIFARIDLADDVVVRTGGSTQSIDCKGADLGPGDRNLAYRAAIAYKDATGWPNNFAIEL
ncbi:MAG: 4-(cytidine 5'-diphospho)-2-C-methyl-D-erythritol kinase, partial [Gemmatimonadaceae bacterium]